VPDEGLTLREAAAILGISEGGVRKRVKRGTLRSTLGEDGKRYVYLDSRDSGGGRGPDNGADGGADALISELRDRVQFVERQLEAERQAHAEARRIIGGLVQRIPELEAPQEPTEDTETVEGAPERAEHRSATGGAQGRSRRPWWRRVFRG